MKKEKIIRNQKRLVDPNEAMLA